MNEMTTHERMTRMFEHREADRVPITDHLWATTSERWHREGLPQDVDWLDHFGLDRLLRFATDISPRYPSEVLEETDAYKVSTTPWGATLKRWTHAAGVPEFIDCLVTDADSWADAKARMTPTRDRVDWDRLKQDYGKWRQQGCWTSAHFSFGFDMMHSGFIGTERVLVAMLTDPEWIADVCNHCLDVSIDLFDMIWNEGYEFDGVFWSDDMGYKFHQFFSMDTYREILKPAHKRACDWAHEHGMKAALHSCGDIRPFVPELIEIGVDRLNPLEVKAGVDPVELKHQHGGDLVLHGGINAVNFEDMDVLRDEMQRVVPEMKKNGGYVLGSDHSVPDSMSLEDFTEFVALAKELGSYE
jgi:uroporphyrinogen decarboxylase